MEPAEQHPVGDVGLAVISGEFVDVVSLCPARWPIAAGKAASSITGGKPDSLPSGEEALLAADIDDLTVGVEADGDHTGIAGKPLDRLD